jgi:hypothetical protein
MMALIEQGSLQPQRLIERTIGLDEAAAMLPGFDRATVAGITIVNPLIDGSWVALTRSTSTPRESR